MWSELQHVHVAVQTENHFIYIQAYGDWCKMVMLRFVPHHNLRVKLKSLEMNCE
jgi:hypothetical protein